RSYESPWSSDPPRRPAAGPPSTTQLNMVSNRSAPTATVVPVLIYEDVGEAINWLCRAFGFTERLRHAGRDGTVSHAQLAIAEGAIMLGRQGDTFRPPRPGEVSQYVLIHVDDVDRHFEHAKQFGARIVKSLTTCLSASGCTQLRTTPVIAGRFLSTWQTSHPRPGAPPPRGLGD